MEEGKLLKFGLQEDCSWLKENSQFSGHLFIWGVCVFEAPKICE